MFLNVFPESIYKHAYFSALEKGMRYDIVQACVSRGGRTRIRTGLGTKNDTRPKRPGIVSACQKSPAGLFDRVLQAAARIICSPQANKFHTCSLRGIFCQVHAPAENDPNFFAACGRQTLRGFFDTLNSPVDCCSRRLDGANPLFSSHREENANRIHLPPPNKHRNFDTKITVLIFVYIRKNQVLTIFFVKFRAATVLSRSGYSCLWKDCHIARL